MIPLSVILDGDNAWPDLRDNPPINGQLAAVAGLASGMASGKPSVALRVELPDGQVVIAQTSLALFLTAGRSLAARHGDPTADVASRAGWSAPGPPPDPREGPR